MAGAEDTLKEQLAPGAPAQAGSIPLCVPELRGNEWTYVKECLDTNWVSSVGAYVDRFEDEVAARVGARYGIATVSGTAALHVSLLLAGVEPGDEVATSALSFIAPANAIRYAGAFPVFIDADPDYWQFDVTKLASFLEEGCERRGGELFNRATGRRVRAVLPVHILGHPAEIEPIVALADRFGLPVVEDAAESFGARYRTESGDWTSVGRFGESGCLSFNGNKLITSGGGGMIVTDDERLAVRARYLTTQAKDDPVAYIHNEVGFNYRLGNVQAALGCAQLEHLDEYIAAKRRIADAYREGFDGVPGLTCPQEAPWASAVFWLFTILVDPAVASVDRDAVMAALDAERIQSRPLWEPLHQSRAHRGSFAWRCDEAERLGLQGLSLPSSVGLDPDEQRRVIAAVRRALA